MQYSLVPRGGAGAIDPNGRKNSVIVGVAVQPACAVNSIALAAKGVKLLFKELVRELTL
ncbi:MAG: hypothetical protein QQW96_17140 [Tychonema bourrellyi B0820]|nr:hypothetical protein [Tychonema bourrellyi B0820]